MSVTLDLDLKQFAKACQQASHVTASLDSHVKNEALLSIATELELRIPEILAANAKDLALASEKGLSGSMLDRLTLDEARIQSMADAVREVAALPDPVGEVTGEWVRPNGIRVGRRRIPLGVIAMIYESRPNVTVDAAALCLKAGNAIILRGGSEAFHSNTALAEILGSALESHNIPAEAVSLVPTTNREAMNELLTLDEHIDLVIPRGGESLIRFVNETSRIPVIKHYKGVCHLFVDKDADTNLALKLLLDGKTSRPGVCNALETLLVHRDIAAQFLPKAAQALADHQVVVKACDESWPHFPSAMAATEADWQAEYLDLVLAVKVVDDYDAAVGHIRNYGSDHTEVIATDNYHTAQNFVRDVNASSRFSDGGQLGLGAEIGISTTKLHAFGPMGLESLTTQKFVVFGQGQIRHAATAS